MGIAYESLDGPSSELWADLKRTTAMSLGQMSAQSIRRHGIPTDVFMAVSPDGGLNLLVPYEGAPEDENLPLSFRGLTIEARLLRLDVEDEPRSFLVIRSRPDQERVFTYVAREMAGLVIVDGFDPMRAVLSTVRRWKAFWNERHDGTLSRSQLVGLIGEIWFLSNVMFPRLGAEAVYHWLGPDGERHDFQGYGAHFEVKVTEKSIPQFHVSSLEQLELPESKDLYIAGIMLRRESSGSIDLVSQVAGLEEKLSIELDALEIFQDKLANVGYRREAEREYASEKFFIRSADLYRVDDNFPRLTHQNINVPSGVSGIEYLMDLSNVVCLSKADLDSALDLLVASHPRSATDRN